MMMADETAADGTVAVIGAGLMGRGIAYAAALGGYSVQVFDRSSSALSSAQNWLNDQVRKAKEREIIASREATGLRSRVAFTASIEEACSTSVVIIEAVIEDIVAKHEVMTCAEKVAPSRAVLATNTSSLLITDVIACLDDPSRGIGMHFFNPVHKMGLVEIVNGVQTAHETTVVAQSVASKLGKEAVLVEDSPGFVTSRVNALIGNEALRMLEEGLASAEDIDKAIKLGLNHPMGPLAMGDLVGWDTRLQILEYLTRTLGERFRPTNLHRKLVAAGRFGRKSGGGIFDY